MSDWKMDAREFGRFLKKGGWYVAYLAARRVKEGNGNGRPPKNPTTSAHAEVSSLAEFAREAGLADTTVAAYLRTWDRASEQGLVQPRSTFVGKPDMNVPLPDAETEPWEGWHTSVRESGRNVKDEGTRAALIQQANADGVGASKVLDVASNKRAVVAAVKADPALAAAIVADDSAMLAMHREDNKRRKADDTPRRKSAEAGRDPLSVTDGLVLIGINADLRAVLDRATAAAAEGKAYSPEMREAMVEGVHETLNLATALQEVLTGRLGQPVTDEALEALLDGGK